MKKKTAKTDEYYEYLKSAPAAMPFSETGHLAQAGEAVKPILLALEKADEGQLPLRISKNYARQVRAEIEQLKKLGLKREIRITAPKMCSQQKNGDPGFTRWVDYSREWRECQIVAAVLERYIDVNTGECVIENYDSRALLTIRQSRHLKASDQKKGKGNKIIYTREHYVCPSCGAEIAHVSDQTDCPYCGAYITFHFFDWQLDSFYLDLHKDSILNDVKTVMEGAKTVAVKSVGGVAGKAAELLADILDEEAEKEGREGTTDNYINYIAAVIMVFLAVVIGILIIILSMPWYVRAGLGILLMAWIVRSVVRYLKRTAQERKKKKIVRYSDGYLKSCIYNEIWKDIDTNNLIDFSLDDILIESVKNKEDRTIIHIVAIVIKKYMLRIGKSKYYRKISA